MIKNNIMRIFLKKTGAGYYRVDVIQNQCTIDEIESSFTTTDMQLIDDIQEMKNDGFESELVMHDNFDEVKETILNKIR